MTASIESANVVGYKTDALAGDNFNMIAIPFTTVTGENIDLNDGSVVFENLIEGEYAGADCDYIEIWNPANDGYTFHFYYPGEGWTDESGNGYFSDDYPEGLPAGAAMWLDAYNGEREGQLKVTFSGAVEASESVSYELVGNNFNMLANPYPVAWNPNNDSITWTGVIEGEYAGADCDYIEVWNPANDGYTFHFLYPGEGWTDESGNGYFEDDYPEGLPAGTPVWFDAFDGEREAKLSVTFSSPISK